MGGNSACRLKFDLFRQFDPSGVLKLLFEVAVKVTGSAVLVFSDAQTEPNGLSSPSDTQQLHCIPPPISSKCIATMERVPIAIRTHNGAVFNFDQII